jgi:hypothetical protein
MNIITHILENNIDINKVRFDTYQNEYSEKFMAFETAKLNLENKYLNGLIYNSWNLNYNTCELSYE